MIWVLLALVVVVASILVLVLRRPRQEPGVTSFRRHIDALSPEARREVMDRVRPPQMPNQGQGGNVQGDPRPGDPKEGPAN